MGIIPAYAGNTNDCHTSNWILRDHPRVCGEHLWRPYRLYPTWGSSPRMRGTHLLGFVCNDCAGIIPAYAGNTVQESAAGSVVPGSSPRMRGTQARGRPSPSTMGIIPAYAGNTRFCPSLSKHSRDHPRVCGEHCRWMRRRSSPRGSSPRMRGTLHGHTIRALQHGIIPAYAGNTRPALQRKSTARDHPRVCGEHPVLKDGMEMRPGSSPRMRGTLIA